MEYVLFLWLGITAIYMVTHERTCYRIQQEDGLWPQQLLSKLPGDGSKLSTKYEFYGMLSVVAEQCQVPTPLIVETNLRHSLASLRHSLSYRNPLLSFNFRRMQEFSPQEQAAMIAHEFGHFRRRYQWRLLLRYFVLYASCKFIIVRCVSEECAADAFAANVISRDAVIGYLNKLAAYKSLSLESRQELTIRLRHIQAL